MKEIWKDIVGFEGFYKISNLGNTISLQKVVNTKGGGIAIRNEKSISPQFIGSYFSLELWKDGKAKRMQLHRVLYEAFRGRILTGHIIHHIDHNKLNNSLDNLKMMTSAQHNQHHFCGGSSWNKNIKYGATEGYKKSNEKRNDNFLKLCEDTYIAFIESKMSKVKFSKVLGINRNTLDSRIKRHLK